MANLSFDISEWYNENDLDYRTPGFTHGSPWDQTLKPKLLKLLAKKMPRNKCYKPDKTNVVVSVTNRSQRDLTKRFNELDIDWAVMENQLIAWSHLRERRQLRIDISFI